MGPARQLRVAVVGSGMAGLVTAYLLRRDPEKKYHVTIFEEGKRLSLDSASLSVTNLTRGCTERVDLPMRAFAGGFYGNLRAMYDYLGVEYTPQPFLFSFSEARNPAYFIHSSNNHQFPPLRPKGVSIFRYSGQLAYLLLCYTWWTICCFMVPPHSHQKRGTSETLAQYIKRIRLPPNFAHYYLLPLLSSVTTCPHDTLLQFPACDLTNYKKWTHGAEHYTVTNGVHGVQEKLSRGLTTRLQARVTAVAPKNGCVTIYWKNSRDPANVEVSEEVFDRVILAVAPDIVGKTFPALSQHMSSIPTIRVVSVVHNKPSTETSEQFNEVALQTHLSSSPAQLIHLHTSINKNGTYSTESAHEQPSGVIITTCPSSSIPSNEVIHAVNFTRVLRTPESRHVVNSLFDMHAKQSWTEKSSRWINGDGGIYLAGGWCWDGLVLLEGCLVSAMRIADAFRVEVPWRDDKPSLGL